MWNIDKNRKWVPHFNLFESITLKDWTKKKSQIYGGVYGESFTPDYRPRRRVNIILVFKNRGNEQLMSIVVRDGDPGDVVDTSPLIFVDNNLINETV